MKKGEESEGGKGREREEEKLKEEEEGETSSAGFQSVRISPLSILTSGP